MRFAFLAQIIPVYFKNVFNMTSVFFNAISVISMCSDVFKDGTLGLLLHGTSVVGFCSEEVADQGWPAPEGISPPKCISKYMKIVQRTGHLQNALLKCESCILFLHFIMFSHVLYIYI